MAEIKWQIVQAEFPEDCNVIVGQSHFIKTAEDLYEALVTSCPGIEFGIGFCEASGDCLIRWEGNNQEMIDLAVKNAQAIAAGHTFFIALRKAYPINVRDGQSAPDRHRRDGAGPRHRRRDRRLPPQGRGDGG